MIYVFLVLIAVIAMILERIREHHKYKIKEEALQIIKEINDLLADDEDLAKPCNYCNTLISKTAKICDFCGTTQ